MCISDGGTTTSFQSWLGLQHGRAAALGPVLMTLCQLLLSLPNHEHCRRELSAAIWRPAVGAAEIVLPRRGTAQPMGACLPCPLLLHANILQGILSRGKCHQNPST